MEEGASRPAARGRSYKVSTGGEDVSGANNSNSSSSSIYNKNDDDRDGANRNNYTSTSANNGSDSNPNSSLSPRNKLGSLEYSSGSAAGITNPRPSPPSKLSSLSGHGGFDRPGSAESSTIHNANSNSNSPDKNPASPSQQIQSLTLSPTGLKALNPIGEKRSPPHSLSGNADSFSSYSFSNNSSPPMKAGPLNSISDKRSPTHSIPNNTEISFSANPNSNSSSSSNVLPIKTGLPRTLNEVNAPGTTGSSAPISGRMNRYKPLNQTKEVTTNEGGNDSLQKGDSSTTEVDASNDNSPDAPLIDNDSITGNSNSNSSSDSKGESGKEITASVDTIATDTAKREELQPSPPISSEIRARSSRPAVSSNDPTTGVLDSNEPPKTGSISSSAPRRPQPPSRSGVIGADEHHASPRAANVSLTPSPSTAGKSDDSTNATNSTQAISNNANIDDLYENNEPVSKLRVNTNEESSTTRDKVQGKGLSEPTEYDDEFEESDLKPPTKIDENPEIPISSKRSDRCRPEYEIDSTGNKEFDMTAGENAMFATKFEKVPAQKTAYQSLQSTCRLSIGAEEESLDDPLHRAIAENSEIDVRMMLDGYGSNASHAICSRDSLGRNAAHILSLSQNVEILALVMSTYRQFVYGQLVQQLGEIENEKFRWLKSQIENPFKEKFRKSVVSDWYEKQKQNFHRQAEFRIECWWLKIMSTRDRNGKTPLNYAVSANVSSSFLRKLFTIGRGNISTKEVNQFRFKSESYNLSHLFNEGSLYDASSGQETANCRETLFDKPCRSADSKISNSRESITRSISFEVSSNPTISINPSIDAFTEFRKREEETPDWDILLPWLYRNILKRTKDSHHINRRDSKESDVKSPQELVLEALCAFNEHREGGLVLVNEFRTFLAKLGICVTTHVLHELCHRYPGDLELTKGKWHKRKGEFKEELVLKQQNRRFNTTSTTESKLELADDKSSSSRKGSGSGREGKGESGFSDSKSVSSSRRGDAKAESKGTGNEGGLSSATADFKDFKLAKEHVRNDIPDRFKDEDADSNELFLTDPYLEEERELSIDIHTFVRVLKSESSLKGLELSMGSYFETLKPPNNDKDEDKDKRKETSTTATSSTTPPAVKFEQNTVIINTNTKSADLPSIVSVEIIKELRRSLVNIPDIEGWTPLVIASKNNNESLIVDLIQMGGDITKLGPDRFSALSVAKTLPVKNALDKELVGKLTSNFSNSMNVRSSYNNNEKSMLFDAFVPQILSLKDNNWAYGKGPIAYAALNGLRSSVTQLLATGLDVNAPDLAGRTALHECSVFVRNAQLGEDIARTCDMLDDLIASGASIASTSVSMRNPLHELFCRNQDDVPSSFKVDDKVFTTKSSDYTSLMCNMSEISSKRRLYITKLLDLGVSYSQLDRSGFSPIHYCAKEGSVQDMLTLLLHGCDPRLKSKTGYTALHVACSNGNYDIANLLARWDGDANVKNSMSQIRGGDSKVAAQLFPRKPPPLCIDTLWSACRSGNLAKVSALIASLGSQPQLFDKDSRSDRCSWLYSKIDMKSRLYKMTPLHAAVLGCGEALLNRGASSPSSSLSSSASSTSSSILSSNKISIPLEPIYKVLNFKNPKGGDIEAKDYDDFMKRKRKSPIGNAVNCGECIDGFIAIISTLIASGASIDAFDINLRTPIMYASALGLAPLVEALIGRGANMNLIDSDQNSALHLAYLYGASSSVHVLERAKCEQILNKNGAFPMDVIGEYATFPSITTNLQNDSK